MIKTRLRIEGPTLGWCKLVLWYEKNPFRLDSNQTTNRSAFSPEGDTKNAGLVSYRISKHTDRFIPEGGTNLRSEGSVSSCGLAVYSIPITGG